MSDFQELIQSKSASIANVASYLDGLDNVARIAHTRSLGRKHLSRLFDLAAGARPIAADFFVPSTLGTMQEVVHYGKNSLGVFTEFAKIFVRPPASAELWGYNRNSALLETVVGPGYFVV